MGTIFLLIIYFTLQMTGQVLAKFSSGMGSLLNLFTLGTYLCFLSRGFIWVLLLRRLRLIAAYPLNGLSYLLIIPVSFFLFREIPDRTSLISTILITLGVIILALGEYRTSRQSAPDRLSGDGGGE